MSDYERRYNVHVGRVSRYVDTAEEALRIIDKAGPDEAVWVNEGYADYEDREYGEYGGGTIVTRRTTGRVLVSTLRFKVERQRVQRLITELAGGARA